jgi:acetylornithine deacetylase
MQQGLDTDGIARLLCDLVALQTVNPMGRPYAVGTPVERPVVEYLERLFSPFDVDCKRLSCSPMHESLLVIVPGAGSGPGTLLEAHIDTVPADDWLERAFEPRLQNGCIYGRGACDDKASLAAMIGAILRILNSKQQPPQTIWFLAAADEEYGQTGIRQFVDEYGNRIGRGIIGEPTECVTVIQHKGTIRWDITVHGRSAHSSQPELGRDAILDAMRLIDRLSHYQQQLRSRYDGELLSGPTLTVTMIHGGRTRNAIADECTVSIDFRIHPGMDGRRAIDDLFAELEESKLPITHGEFQCFAPALNTSADSRLVQAALRHCREVTGRHIMPAGVPYGSDAGWIPGGVPTIVLGPGNIAQAHAVDEFVELKQVTQAAEIYRRLLLHDWLSSSSV